MGAQAVRLSNVDINTALENKDFEVLFQPIFDLGNGALARMETFVRWRHPTLGVLPPGAFISFFESQNRMGELTRYILSAALNSYGAWRGPYAPGFSINLSLADLADEAFATHLTSLLRDEEFPADLITLECPMPPVDSDLEGMIDRFTELRETGVRLAIEVRGRASEFLRTIDPFPFDEIKTGGSSILRFARTVRGPGLSAISDLLDIAKRANAVTTAVGVEDQASLSALRGLGFTAAQGNHLAKVGALADFRPARVNHVRELLELPALKGEDLSALFRTSAPTPNPAPSQETQTPQFVDPDEKTADGATTQNATEPAQADAEKQALVARARKKAKALALAKRAKARDARKAAAIKRAKAKVAHAKRTTDDTQIIDVDTEDPRELQDRIAQEFTGAQSAPPDAAPPDAAQMQAASAIDVGFDTSTADPQSEGSTQAMSDPDENPAPVSKTDIQTDTADAEEAGSTAQKTVSRTPQSAPAGDPNSRENLSLKMPVGAAPVHFRPGMSVQGAVRAYGREADNPVTPPQGANPAAPATDIAAPDIAFEDDSGSLTQAVDPQPAKPASEPSQSGDAQDRDAPPADHRVADHRVDGSAETIRTKTNAGAGQRRKKKNFLARKYKVMPTHFWPKPWRRALQGRGADDAQALDVQALDA